MGGAGQRREAVEGSLAAFVAEHPGRWLASTLAYARAAEGTASATAGEWSLYLDTLEGRLTEGFEPADVTGVRAKALR